MRWRRLMASVWLTLWTGMAWAEAPHILYETKTKNATSTSTQTDQTLWDPDAGKRFILQGVTICSDAAVQVELEVSDADVVPPVYQESYGCKSIGYGAAPIYMSATDAVLTYTTSSAGHSGGYRDVSVQAVGYEIQ